MSGQFFNIEKLDESNYDSWNMQVKSVLVHQELWSIVSQGEKPEEANARAAWVVKDEKAVATIILSLTSMQVAHIRNCTTAKDAWNTLREIHRPKGPVRKVSLFKQLLNIRMADGERMQRYICNFASVVEKLAETGVDLQEELFVIMLLASLPKTYEPLVVALESRDELPSLSTLKVKLIEEGERKKANKEEEGTVQAFMARDFNGTKGTEYNKNKENSKKYNNNNPKNIRCFNCKRKGHYAVNCKEQRKENEQKGQQYNRNNGDKKNSLFSAVSNSNLNANVWCIDSGASSHLCCNRDMFDELKQHNEEIMLAGSNSMKTEGIGTVRLTIDKNTVTLVDVLFVPGLQCNFISVSKAVNYGNSVNFNKNMAKLTNVHGEVILRAKKVRDLFLFQINNNNNLFLARKSPDEAMKWHCRYGHLNFGSMRELIEKKLVRGLNLSIPADIQCTICMKCKCTQRPFTTSESRADDILEIIHTDVCGPMNTTSLGGAKYLLTFIDDKSRYVHVYFLKTKDEVFTKFREFHAMIERQTGKKIRIIRSDNGTEFVNNTFNEHLKQKGILRQLTVPYTPQQNGIAERFNRTLIEMARCMLVAENLGEHLWAEAVNTAAYLRNRAPTRALNGDTPYNVFHGRLPFVGHLRVFGSTTIALDKRRKCKFGAKGKQYLMVGYSDTSKAYRLYDPQTQQLIVSRDVYFVEPNGKSSNEVNVPILEDLPRVTHELQTKNNDGQLTESRGDVSDDVSDFEGFESAEEEKQEQKVVRGPGRPRIARTGGPGRPRKEFNVLSFIRSDQNIEIPKTVD